MPDAPGLELIFAEINRSHAGAVIDTSFNREQACLVVDPASILDVLTWLRDTPGQEYTFLSSVHGVDYYPHAPRFGVHYELVNRPRYERLRVKAILPDPDVPEPEVATGTAVPGVSKHSVVAPAAAGGIDPEVSGAAEREAVPPPAPATTVRNGEVLPMLPSCVALFPTADFQEREVFDFFGVVFDGHPDLRRILMPEDYVGWPQRRDFPVGGEPVLFTKDEVSSPGWWK